MLRLLLLILLIAAVVITVRRMLRARPADAAAPVTNRAEALAILGLSDGASREDIVRAHRTLIQKLHPDRGGNAYLATQINRAKDLLLGE